MEGLDGEGQAAEAEPSPSAGRAQFSGLTDTPPRTPSQDAAGRAARAKRVASSREMAAQMKQLEQRLMALRAELREKENKARQAEGSVQDLKLQLDDLQTQTVSDRDAHDQEVEGLERKLTEAEREAAAANEKAAKLHKQLHGSTFHLKLAQEAMKKVRQVEAEAEAAKAAAEAEALKAGAETGRLMLDLEDKGTQTDPLSKPGSPALQTLRRPMPPARNTVRPVPVPRPQQPIVKREPKPVEPRPAPQPRPPPNVHVATAAGDEVVEGLPPARTGLPQARPTLRPKRQPQNLMREIHVPTSLLKRRGHAAAEDVSVVSPDAVPDAASGAATSTDGNVAETAVAEALAPATVPAGKVVNATIAAAAAQVKPTPVAAQTATPPQLGIMAAGSHAAPAAGKPPTGHIRAPVSSHVASQPAASAAAGGGTAGLCKHEPVGSSRLQTPQEAAAASAADFSQPQDRPSSSAESAQPEAPSTDPGEQTRPISTSSSSQASVSRPGTAEGLDSAEQFPEDSSWQIESASDQVLQIQRAAVGRVHRHRAYPRPQSPIQTQISGVHGGAPGETAQQAPAPTVSGPAQRAQHGRSKKVPPLNMAVMKALKQQVSGLVPLDSRGSFKTARTVLQQTAPASQRALSSRLPTETVLSKAESMTQLAPLTAKAQHRGSLPDVTPLSTTKASAFAPISHSPPQTAALLQSMLPGIVSAATPRQILPLDATLQLVGDIYDSKSVADLAALRQQVPCKPMQEFVQHYLQTRFGAGAGGSWQGAWHQLETAVKMHGADDRVAAFRVTCGLVQASGGVESGAATSAQVLYNGSQPFQEPPTTSAWAAAWLQTLRPISGIVAGDASQPPGSEGQLVPSQPTVRQVALAASLAGLSGAALAEEVGDQLGMLWPTRLQPALLRALPYLALCNDRWTLQVMPSPEVLTAAILKVAAGTPELAASLTPDAFLTEVDDSAADCIPAGYRAKRRQAVSAEVATVSLEQPITLKKIHKSMDAEEGIRAAMQHCFLFTAVCGAREGEEGDNFYVIESGQFKATKVDGNNEKLLFTYRGEGAFGELALMYNCPRAATVMAESHGVVWGMERCTFRSIIVVSTMEKRQRYEASLASMPLFAALSPEQRAIIADCLSLETFEMGEYILKEGEELSSTSKFYLVQSGIVECFKQFNGQSQHVKTIEAGGFFGEVALVEHVNVRAADCIAKDRVKLLSMGRDTFERLMGPAETILAGQVSEYQKFNANASSCHSAAAEVV
ncbi:hypothetical protein WJX79_001295 [Trebouxia sp. C0005]